MRYITSIFEAYGWSGWTGRDNYGNPYALLNATSSHIANKPLHFLYGGAADGGLLNSVSSQSWYWTATANSTTNAYNLYFDSGGIYPSFSHIRYAGLSIRCVAR